MNALSLEWADVILEPLSRARFVYLRVRKSRSKNAPHNIPVTNRAASILHTRCNESGTLVLANCERRRNLVTKIYRLQRNARTTLKPPEDFVIYWLHHTMLLSLWDSRGDSSPMLRIFADDDISVLQWYAHQRREPMEEDVERLQRSGAISEIEPNVLLPPTRIPWSRKRSACNSLKGL